MKGRDPKVAEFRAEMLAAGEKRRREWLAAGSRFERAMLLLRKPKKMYLVSRELLEGMVDEMVDAARRIAQLERTAPSSYEGIDRVATEEGWRRRFILERERPDMAGVIDLGAGMDPEKE